MASKRYKGIDSSDMQLWASSPCATAFIADIVDSRESALRALIKTPTEEKAAVVRAYDKVLALFDDNRNVNN